MPKQEKSKLHKTRETNSSCIFFITFFSLIISVLAVCMNDFETAFHTMAIAFSGFLFHSFPTNSTLLFDRLFVFYGATKLIAERNSEIVNLIKYCISFYSIARNVRNNLEEKIPGAVGGRDKNYWLTRHLYDVQFPMLIVCLMVLLDRNLISK